MARERIDSACAQSKAESDSCNREFRRRCPSRRTSDVLLLLVALCVFVAACSSGGNSPTTSANPSRHPRPAAPAGAGHASAEATSNARNPNVIAASGGRGEAIGALRYDVGEFGYQEHEYYFEGTAKAYPPMHVLPAAYRSRMIVWTPKNPAHFNGITIVEWAEVSDYGRYELTVELNYESSMLESEGYAFALVSAEERGVCQRGPTGCVSTSLEGADPARYSSLHHPGDAYSFDIFSQAMQAIKHPRGISPLGKLKTRFVIAEGFQRSVDKYFPGRRTNPDRIAGAAVPFRNLRPAQRLPGQRRRQRRSRR